MLMTKGRKNMARSTVYNHITDEASLSQILPENQNLAKDFLDYI